LQFTLTIADLSEFAAEALETALEEAGVSPLATSRNETDEGKRLWELVAYFDKESEARALAKLLPSNLAIDIAPLPETDWVRRSLEGLPLVVAGRFCVHGSHDRSKQHSSDISLEIDASTAFGTGHHPTTIGCLLALDALLKRGKPRRILDIGCGTGILGLAAAKALHVPVLASDVDLEAVHVARANARRNDASPSLRILQAAGLSHPLIRSGGPYDLIFANILARPLIALAQPIARNIAPGGTLILSGLTNYQVRPIRAAYRSHAFVSLYTIKLGSWSTLVLSPGRDSSYAKKVNTRSMNAPGVEKGSPIDLGRARLSYPTPSCGCPSASVRCRIEAGRPEPGAGVRRGCGSRNW